MNKPILVTSPLLPKLEELTPYLEDIWERKWLTNNGHYHKQLEAELCQYLGVPYISVFSNGTLALITALQALRITGEVITTPFSFVATTHSLWWNNTKPVFVDIDPLTFNLDPNKIEAAITPQTTAIMPVHVYGTPCDTKKIQDVADKYNLKIIYDAAHAFGVKTDDVSVLNAGDLSILSFHATKVFSTIEGGAIVCKDAQMKQHIDDLKNFGFRDEVTVVAPGINAKMNEVQAAFGVLALTKVDQSIAHRQWVANQYVEALKGIDGIRVTTPNDNVRHNYSYFPIFVDESKYGISRDQLYEKMKEKDVFGRRYFYPLISEFSTYRGLTSAAPENLPVAHKVASEVICLPIHGELCQDDIQCVINTIKQK